MKTSLQIALPVLMVLSLTQAAHGDGRKPKYCVISQTTDKVMQPPIYSKTFNYYYSGMVQSREDERLKLTEVCRGFLKEHPEAECRINEECAEATCVSDVAMRHFAANFSRKLTPGETFDRLCSETATCLTQAVANCDAEGVRWAKAQSKELSCGF